MRAKEFLLEYDRNTTIQKLGARLEPVEQIPAEQVVAQLEQMDPTRNKQYMLWLAKQYMARQFRLEDAGRIKEVLSNFDQVKPRLPQEQRDINRMTFYQLDDLVDRVFNVQLQKDTPQSTGTFPVVADSEVLYNGPLGQLSIPKTKKASCELGRGTKWCTAAKNDNQFADYNRQGPLYIWRDRNGSKYQFHFEDNQYMDAQDRPLDQKTANYFRTQHPVLKKLFAEKEPAIARDPIRAYKYAKNVIGGRWPEVEPEIAKDPELAYLYAHNVIKGRWPEVEPMIAKDPEWAYVYASDVIRGRWPEVEPMIAKDPSWAYHYASDVIKGRWPEAEPGILKNIRSSSDNSFYSGIELAIMYAHNAIKGRWPEAEPMIAKDPYWAYEYAKDVIKGRWPEIEPKIAKDPELAYLYAQDVIKGRWPEAELAIAKYHDPAKIKQYKQLLTPEERKDFDQLVRAAQVSRKKK